MIKLYVIAISICLLFACTNNTGEYVYADTVAKASLRVNENTGDVSEGDVSSSMKKCDISYKCVNTSVFKFFVPKEFPQTRSWTVDGAVYTAQPEKSIR